MSKTTLSIQSFGARLRVRDGLFIVFLPDSSGGGNHQEEEYAVSTVESIQLHPSTSVTADALLLAQEHHIPVHVLDKGQSPVIFMAGLQPSSSVSIWHRQLVLHGTPEGLGYARDWLCLKIRRKIELLNRLRSYRTGPALEHLDTALQKLRDTLVRMSSQPLQPVVQAAAALRGIEGYGQRVYLETLSHLLPSQNKFEGRSRQPAEDLFNALLNYGYGILYKWVEQALWEAGLSPYIGFLHSDKRHHKSLLFDFIEPFRPWMDKVAFGLCVRKEINIQQHASILATGGVWLNKAGKKLFTEAVLYRFDRKVVQIGDRSWRLRLAISEEARQFALLLRNTVSLWSPSADPQPVSDLILSPN